MRHKRLNNYLTVQDPVLWENVLPAKSKRNTMTRLHIFVLTLIVSILPTSSVIANTETMLASWYGPGMDCYQTSRGCLYLMANGEEFDMNDPTVVAHKTLPFGTELRLTNPENGLSIVVTVQDRGPFFEDRELDLSRGAAQRIQMIDAGEIELEVERLP